MAEMTKSLTDGAMRALGTFAEANSIIQQREAIQTLVRLKALDASRGTHEFREGLERLASRASDGSADDVAAALALAMRIAAVAKTVRNEIPRRFGRALTRQPASAQKMDDPKDREYLAQALAFASGEWLVPYVAQEAVIEESGEKARLLLLDVLLSKASALDAAFYALADGFRRWSVETIDIGGSRARRLQRVMYALRPALLNSEAAAGARLGSDLNALLDAAVGSQEIAARGLRDELAVAMLDTLSQVVRLHFSLATEPDTYAVLPNLRRLFAPGDWPDRVRPSLRSVATQIEEAIAILAKQGIADNKLRATLDLLLGEIWARDRLTKIAERFSGLEPSVQQWLTGSGRTRTVQSTPIAMETRLQEVDQRIAILLRDAAEARDAMTPAMSLTTTMEAQELRHALLAARRVLEQVSALALHRGLRLRGHRGDETSYLPAEHALGEHPPGSRIVRIVRPLVERHQPNGASEVILKADVAPL